MGLIKVGQKAQVTLKAFPGRPVEGAVLFVFPGVRPDSRTGRIAIEVQNPNDRLKADMFADVVVRVGADQDPVVAVPDSAIIDDGARRHVLVDVGEGRFDARPVTTGAEGNGYVEVLSGVSEGERVVVSANFLIDSEANVAAALAAFSAAAPKK
jgi:membrane fusion protein, copper/silver efflux system